MSIQGLVAPIRRSSNTFPCQIPEVIGPGSPYFNRNVYYPFHYYVATYFVVEFLSCCDVCANLKIEM